MKRIILILIGSVISTTALAGLNCQKHIEQSTQTVYYVPAYEAKATYYFDTKEKEAFATINWKHNEEATKRCIEFFGQSYPNYQLRRAYIRLDYLNVKVFKGTNTQDLILFPEVGGFYNGTTEKISVDFNSRAEIKKAIQQGKEMISITGEFSFGVDSIQRSLLSEIPCLNGSEEKGVLGLHKRLGQVIKLINSRPGEEMISRESILDQFMTSCVKFEELDATTFSEMELVLLKKTILVDGKIPMYGNKKVQKSIQAEAISLQETTSLDF
jgi:hypothetical protein